MRILTRSDVTQALSMSEAIAVMKDAFAQLSANQAIVPLRTHIPVEAHNGVALFMPAFVKKSEALAIKIVTVYSDNPARGLPLINAVVVVLDAETGRAQAIIDGTSLTALRTAAGAGAATDVLARRDAHNAVVFGTGVQARSAVLALCAARHITRLDVIGLLPGDAETLIERVRGEPGVPSDIRGTWNDPQTVAPIIRQADLIYCATTSRTPLFDGNDVQPGTHVNAIGSFTPDAREVDTAFIKRCDKIVVDAYSGALAEAGDLLIPIEEGALRESDIYGELGEITGGIKPGRTKDSEITFFKSVGNAVQDAAAAQAVFANAVRLNLGTTVEL